MKLGQYSVPDYKLTECIAIAERVSSGYRGSISVSGLADELQMAEGGGGFHKKLAAVRAYGLLDGRQQLTTTQLAERILFPANGEEAAKSRAEAFLRVGLFKKLSERFADKIPEAERFTVILTEVTGAPRSEVNRVSTTIRRLYMDGHQHVASSGLAAEAGSNGTSVSVASRKTGGDNQILLVAGDMELKLPVSLESIDIIVSALNVLRRRLLEDVRSAAGSE